MLPGLDVAPIAGELDATLVGPCDVREPGPLKTRTASGLQRFDELLEKAREQSPAHRLVTIADVGHVAAFLASDGARRMTGNIAYVDAGMHIMG